MPLIWILFYANYTILATQKGGHGTIAPPKYAPGPKANSPKVLSHGRYVSAAAHCSKHSPRK